MAYKRIRFRKNNTMEVIGVIGTEKGVGATHLSLMLGVFLSIVKGYKVAVVELNRPGSIRHKADESGRQQIIQWTNLAQMHRRP